jgi:hypothetical protein
VSSLLKTLTKRKSPAARCAPSSEAEVAERLRMERRQVGRKPPSALRCDPNRRPARSARPPTGLERERAGHPGSVPARRTRHIPPSPISTRGDSQARLEAPIADYPRRVEESQFAVVVQFENLILLRRVLFALPRWPSSCAHSLRVVSSLLMIFLFVIHGAAVEAFVPLVTEGVIGETS